MARCAAGAGGLLFAAGAIGLAGCGDDEETKANKVSIEVTGTGQNVRITAPKSVEGGLAEITFKNSTGGDQEAQLIQVEGDHSVQEVVKVMQREGGPIPSWLRGAGGVGELPAGETRSSTQQLSGGNYYVIGSSERGKPATASFRVEGGEAGGDLPEPPGRITARDYSFATVGLKPGRNRVLFENSGAEPHHVVAAPLNKGADVGDVRSFFQRAQRQGEERAGRPPADFEKGTASAVLDGGAKQVTELDLKRGDYALLCFIQDRRGGPPHVFKGMIGKTTVR